jgi:hypothetical protein
VSCPSQTICEAVGFVDTGPDSSTTLAEGWHAGRWSLQQTPTLRASRGSYSGLGGVSCSGEAACVAVGETPTGSCDYGGRGLVEKWNGSQWSLQARICAPGDTYLYGVSCPSSTTCMAVGQGAEGGPAAYWLTGSRWSDAALSADLQQFDAVSCPLTSVCIAGYVNSPTIIRWDEHNWSTDKVVGLRHPDTLGITGISCVSPTTCVAVTQGIPNSPSLISQPTPDFGLG